MSSFLQISKKHHADAYSTNKKMSKKQLISNTLSELSNTEESKDAQPSKVKTLPPSVVKDIEQKNIARKLAGLPMIKIKVRRCLICGYFFESSGNRTCGCSNRATGSIAGREII